MGRASVILKGAVAIAVVAMLTMLAPPAEAQFVIPPGYAAPTLTPPPDRLPDSYTPSDVPTYDARHRIINPCTGAEMYIHDRWEFTFEYETDAGGNERARATWRDVGSIAVERGSRIFYQYDQHVAELRVHALEAGGCIFTFECTMMGRLINPVDGTVFYTKQYIKAMWDRCANVLSVIYTSSDESCTDAAGWTP
jgi:hypothetical protein